MKYLLILIKINYCLLQSGRDLVVSSCGQVVALSSWNGAILVGGELNLVYLAHGRLAISIAILVLVSGKDMYVSCRHELSIMRPSCWH